MIHVLHCHQEAWQWLKNFFVSTKGIIKMPLRSVPTQSSHEYASLFSTTPHSQTLRVSLSSPSNLAGAVVLPLFFQNPPWKLSFLSLRCRGSNSSSYLKHSIFVIQTPHSSFPLSNALSESPHLFFSSLKRSL